LLLANCSTENPVLSLSSAERRPNLYKQFSRNIPPVKTLDHTIKYLALETATTVAKNVCYSCKFPEQLQQSLNTNIANSYSLKVIAQTGWTTTNLNSGINNQNLNANYDFVSLLIGVNNQ
jgi:hypothetical protein